MDLRRGCFALLGALAAAGCGESASKHAAVPGASGGGSGGQQAHCGDSLCDPKLGESATSCPVDCPLSADCGHQVLALGFGEMDAQMAGDGGLTLMAPHGKYDYRTKQLAAELALAHPANVVRAWGYRTDEHYINVNRPTETTSETWTERAQAVFDVFRACVQQLGPADYVEIHGNSKQQTALEIQVATVNVDAALAQLLKDTYQSARSGLLLDFALKIEPLDEVYWTAGGNKAAGMMNEPPGRCLHIELPKALRTDESRPQTVAALAKLLAVLSAR